MNIVHKRMTVDEFLPWAEAQPRGRFELIAGEIVEMSPERATHAMVKLAVAVALRDAIRDTGLDYRVFPDGMTVRIDKHTAFEPDAALEVRGSTTGNDVELHAPTLVVEVLSPGTGNVDRSAKLLGYFRVPSIQHYLIVDPEQKSAVHHQRKSEDVLDTRIVADGELTIDPPGFSIPVDTFWQDMD